MRFKQWLEDYQTAFPFMQEDDPLDPDQLKRIKRFKNRDNYVRTMQRGGRKTENSAKDMINKPIGHWYVGDEEIVNFAPNMVQIPSRELSNGQVMPERYIGFVHVQATQPLQSKDPKYDGKRRYRILAFWQGPQGQQWSAEDAKGSHPLAGAAGVGGYLDTFWVDPEYKNSDIPLYKRLREFAAKIGYPSLDPKDRPGARDAALKKAAETGEDPDLAADGTELTSKEFRGAQAKYDWERAQANQPQQPSP